MADDLSSSSAQANINLGVFMGGSPGGLEVKRLMSPCKAACNIFEDKFEGKFCQSKH
jgi:hypothetical protein